jgi:anti-anti-sigma factor
LSHEAFALVLGRTASEVVVVARGELDLAAAQPLEAALVEACRLSDGDVVVDFSAVTFSDAAALGRLAAAGSRLAARGCRLEVRGAQPRQARIFRLAGLARLLENPSGA